MTVRFLPAVALAAAALVGCNGDGKDVPPKVRPPGTIDVDEVRGPALTKALQEQKGKVVVVDCWATWCAPCVKKFPHLVELHTRYADKGLVCVSVSLDKLQPEGYTRDKVLDFLKEKGAAFPNFVVADPDEDEKVIAGSLGEDFTLLPYMALFDRSGRRVWGSSDRPKLTDEQLEKKIEGLLADAP
jgi:thiol-disulfide isomerase/thioredoxin